MIFPIGHDESLRKLPWLTVGIMALCVLVQVRACNVTVDDEVEEALRREQQALIVDALPEALLGRSGRHVSPVQLLAIPGMAGSPRAEELLGNPDAQRLPARAADDEDRPGADEEAVTLERMRRLTPEDVGRAADALRQGHGIAADDPRRVRYLEIEGELARMHRRDPVRLLAYRPADGLSLGLLTHAFAHAGWLHLVGNLLFLWLVGCNLEDRWGRAFFGAFYALGAIGSGLCFRLMHPESAMMLVGASGAIAAAMGAFLVNFHGAEIRFAYLWLVIPPRWGTFSARAMFVMPFWFLEDLASAWLFEAQGDTQVAYSAHVGGFLLGVAVALAVRLSGFERKYLLPAASKGVEWSEDPDVVRALDLATTGRHAEAVGLLRGVLARSPRHLTAALEATRSAVAMDDRAACEEFIDRAVQALWRDRRQVDLVELAEAVTMHWPRFPWSEASLSQVARAQLAAGHLERAEHSLRRLLADFPDGVQAARVRNDLADLLERQGQYREARQLAQALLGDFPDHPLAPAARERLARTEGMTDRPSPERVARRIGADGAIDLPLE